MKAILSRYKPKYLRALIYMLQASEYDIREYLAWYNRTTNFNRVEYRKQLAMTTKAKMLLAVLYIYCLIATMALIGAANLASSGEAVWWLYIVGITIFLPHLLAYAILVPLLAGQVLIQKPRERAINVETKRLLAASKATRIAIAGSYGKTTMKEILRSVIGAGKKVAATPGNYNTPIGINRFLKKLEGNEDVLIFELGEYYPGDVRKLTELVDPEIGVLTGINEAHLSRFKSLDKTVGTIYELVDCLGPKAVYVNGESKLVKESIRLGSPVYTSQGVDGWVVDQQSIKVGLNGTSFTAKKGKLIVKARSKLLGVHQVGPLAVTIAIAERLGLDIAQIERGIATTKPFEHRMELKHQPGGAIMIDDAYNGNPDGVKAAINFLKDLPGYRRIYITPGLVETGHLTAKVHREIGRQLVDATEVVVLVKNSVTGYIAEGLKANKYKGEVIWYDDGLAVMAALPSITKAGDIIMLQNDWSDNYA